MKIALTLLLVIATIQNAIAQDVTVTVFDFGAEIYSNLERNVTASF